MSERREIKEKLADLKEQEELVLSQLRDIFQEQAQLEVDLAGLKGKKIPAPKAVKDDDLEKRDQQISQAAVLKGQSPKEIAAAFGLTQKAVKAILAERGIAEVAAEVRGEKPVRATKSPGRTARLDLDPEELLARNLKGETTDQLAAAFNCSTVTIGNRLREAKKAAGIEIKRGRPKAQSPVEDKPKRQTATVTPIERKRRGRPPKNAVRTVAAEKTVTPRFKNKA